MSQSVKTKNTKRTQLFALCSPGGARFPLIPNNLRLLRRPASETQTNPPRAASAVSWIPVSSPLNFHLEQYDGPLDLLLDLIRKQEINIYDIPIARITQQYLEFMQKAVEMNIELSAEFVYMAATLIHIKSKMLLPRWKN
jgi:hypothetical protein